MTQVPSQPQLNNVEKMEPAKNQFNTTSEQDQNQYLSQQRLIQSQYFTMQLAVNYLYLWRNNSKLVKALLDRILKFPRPQIRDYVPTIILIMSIQQSNHYQSFSQKLVQQSLTWYLLIRWSYITYWQDPKRKQINLNKLDSAVLRGHSQQNSSNKSIEIENQLKQQQQSVIHENVKLKFMLSEYTQVINDYYQRLFNIPQKLKSYQKSQRLGKLKQYLSRISNKFQTKGNRYMKGIVFPVLGQSNMIVRTLNDYCFPFSTKERVPFKLVFETLSQKDLSLKKKENYGIEQTIEKFVKSNQSMILPHTYFGQQWTETKKKIASNSPYGHLPSYQIRAYMIKSGDDLRQQYLAMQLIKIVQKIIKKQNLKLWIKSYDVIPFDQQSGLIEFVDDTRTISYLKQVSNQKSLRRIYQQLFLDNFQKAMLNFLESLAGYSIIQYLFQIKDRHNNNIMIDRQGHLIHIDFSFMISSSPGNMNFQRAPFKLVQDYFDMMEGPTSDLFQHFHMLFFLGLKYLRNYKKQIMDTLHIMTHNPNMKCFIKFDRSIMQQRFHSNATDQELKKIVDGIVFSAWCSYTTSGYDKFQWYTNAIYW